MKRWLIAALVLASCKTRGTIDIAFEGLDGGCDDAGAVATHSIVYAQPNVMCADCQCGACFGDEGGIDGCSTGTCGAPPTDISLDLSPGQWAVIVRLFDGARAVAEGCIEIFVDADGVQSKQTDGVLQCPACAAP